MKHIFSIHSPLTFFVSYAIIDHLKLDKEDVIFISKNYKVPIDDYKVYSIEYPKSKWYNYLQMCNLPAKYDLYIKKLTGGEAFIAYLTWITNYEKIIITNPLCKQFHFIEEGIPIYKENNDLYSLTLNYPRQGFRIKSLFDKSILNALKTALSGFNQKLLSLHFHYMGYISLSGIKFYGISNNAFYNAPQSKKVILKPSPGSEVVRKMAKEIKLDNEVIWIDGSFGKDFGFSENQYHKAIHKAIDRLEKMNLLKRIMYLKLRPNDLNLDKSYLIKALKNKEYHVEILPDNIVLESVFLLSKNCIVIGALSTALETAQVFGHKSYSIISLFEKRNEMYINQLTGYWKNVKML